MDFNGGFRNLVKEVLFQTTSFVRNDRFFSFLHYVHDQLWLAYCDFCILHRIFVAILFRFFFGTWLDVFKVVPFQVYEKNNYFEDPGVVEMRALLRGEDCCDTNLDQRQQLPFPPADYDPYDKIYLAIYFYRFQRKFRNMQASWSENNNLVYRIVRNFPMYQYMSKCLTGRVAVNIQG